jgi:hypothetical protein
MWKKIASGLIFLKYWMLMMILLGWEIGVLKLDLRKQFHFGFNILFFLDL